MAARELYADTREHTCTQRCTHTHAHTHMHTDTDTRMHTDTHLCTHRCTHTDYQKCTRHSSKFFIRIYLKPTMTAPAPR